MIQKSKLTQYILLVFVLLSSQGSWAQTRFQPQVERLYSYTIETRGISFQVYSGGCTSKKSFRLLKSENAVSGLLLYRVVDDRCKGYFPSGTPVFFSYPELNISRGQSFQVLNPLKVF